MNLVVHPDADAELAAAVDWYEERGAGLGEEFEQDVLDALELILETPLAWQAWQGLDQVRVFPLDRFPYVIPYAVREGAILVLAIAHSKRAPGYWRVRAR